MCVFEHNGNFISLFPRWTWDEIFWKQWGKCRCGCLKWTFAKSDVTSWVTVKNYVYKYIFVKLNFLSINRLKWMKRIQAWMKDVLRYQILRFAWKRNATFSNLVRKLSIERGVEIIIRPFILRIIVTMSHEYFPKKGKIILVSTDNPRNKQSENNVSVIFSPKAKINILRIDGRSSWIKKENVRMWVNTAVRSHFYFDKMS